MKNERATGRRVRGRTSAADRERLVAEFRASGLSRQAFAQQHGIHLTTFHGWLQRRVLRKATGFAEVQVAPWSQAAIELLLPNGTRIGIRHQGKREELVALIRGVAGC